MLASSEVCPATATAVDPAVFSTVRSRFRFPSIASISC
jgi:hypothetical protein